MVKLGLVMGSVMPRPRARPRVKVVLPVPTSPTSSITRVLGPVSRLAKFLPKSSIACSEVICIEQLYHKTGKVATG